MLFNDVKSNYHINKGIANSCLKGQITSKLNTGKVVFSLLRPEVCQKWKDHKNVRFGFDWLSDNDKG